jgi:hypothetical protein
VSITFLQTNPEPVEIELVRHHAYKKTKRGCAVCRQAKMHPDHLGAPTSFQAATGSGNQFAYQNMKKAWQRLLHERLEASGLPRGLTHVLVEGQCTFPDRTRRDQGNHRFMLEKAMGDALVAGGWLEDDDWSRYEFGGLSAVYEKGVSRTRLMVFGS